MTATRMAPSTPLCVGRHDLFDSDDWRDHRRAARLCRVCPVTAWCEQQKSLCAEPCGTWAGVIESAGRSTLSDADERLEDVYGTDEARDAWRVYRAGARGAWAAEGYTVYVRRVPHAARVPFVDEPDHAPAPDRAAAS